MNDKTSIIITGIIVIGLLETIALLKGINGVLLTATISSIVGLVCLMFNPPKILSIMKGGS